MSDDLEGVQKEWCRQSFPLKEIDMKKLTASVEEFERSINLRNFFEWIAALIMAPLFIYYAMNSNTFWSQLFNIEIAFSCIFISFHIFYRGRSVKNNNVEASSSEYVDYQRRQIQNQIELISSVRYWYVMPIMIGLIGLTCEKIYLNWSLSNPPWFHITYLLSVILLGVGIVYLNEVITVRKLQVKLNNLIAN
jgi:hypothetical protein